MQDPELNFEQAYEDYRRLGYSDKWINQRLRSIEVRKELTDEWDRAGVKDGQQYASLTDIITRGWSGKTTRQYKQYSWQRLRLLRLVSRGIRKVSGKAQRWPERVARLQEMLGRNLRGR